MKFRLHVRKIASLLRYLAALLSIILASSCSGDRNNGDISASGNIEATEVNVSSKVGGEVKTLLVNEGSAVNHGDTLAIIDHSTLDLQLKQAEAGVELSDAQLRLLLNGARSEDIQQGEEGLKQAEANLKIAEEDDKRIRGLFETKSATQKQKDDAEARNTVALAQYNSAKQTLKKLKSWARPEEIRAAQARVAQAKSSIDLLKKTISDCYITSPVSGIVTHKPVEVGELVGQGTTVVTISKLDKVNLMIYISDVELGKVKLGQQAEVRIDTAPNKVFKGKVVYISPTAEFTPKNVQTKEDRVKLVFGIKIEINNPDGTLKPGMPADATLKTSFATESQRQSETKTR